MDYNYYDLHYSRTHLKRYLSDPLKFVKQMNGIDKDLASHFTVIKYRGICLFGVEIDEIFNNINASYFFENIWNDIRNAESEIIDNPVYVILNLCRALAYKEEQLVLSKHEGATWALKVLPKEFYKLIIQAQEEYATNKNAVYNPNISTNIIV